MWFKVQGWQRKTIDHATDADVGAALKAAFRKLNGEPLGKLSDGAYKIYLQLEPNVLLALDISRSRMERENAEAV